MQAPLLDGGPFDAFAVAEDGWASTKVDVGGGQVVEALVVAVMVVVLDEAVDLGLERSWKVVVLDQDAVLQGLMPAFDLALGLRVIGRAADVVHIALAEPFGEFGGDVAGAVVRQQPRLMADMGLVAA